MRARQQQALTQARRRASRTPDQGTFSPSQWAHCDLAALFREAGNVVESRGPDKAVTGHKPVHGSSSGTCMVLFLSDGHYWCSSPGCGAWGDAATWVMTTQECGYAEAAEYLTRRFGPPAGGAARKRVRGSPLWRKRR